MQNIIWIGNPFFVNKLADCGWKKVFTHNFQNFTLFTYEDLVRLAGFTPDVVVVADKSMPPFVLGVEDFPCLTVFYAVDSHLQSWYPYYAQGFDLCLLSLKDHQSLFQGRLKACDILWSPPFAQDAFRPKDKLETKCWDCLFVGRVNQTTPKRRVFLETLGKLLPGLHVVFGDFVQLFPKARVVLNYCEHGDLNFRVFEALGLGCALVTPMIANGQSDLFQDGEEMLCFDPEKPEEALAGIQRLLNDTALCRHLEEKGLEAIDRAHRASHRAKTFTEKLQSLAPQAAEIIAQRQAEASKIRQTYLKLPYLLWANEMADPAMKASYLAAAR